MLGNQFIKIRLCEPRFITFVMTIFTVAQQVNVHVLTKLRTEIRCKTNRMYHRFHVISIHVHHRRFGYFRDICAIHGRTRVLIIGGKRNLVIHHNVNSSAGAVTFQSHHLRHLIYDSLTCNRTVAVNHNRKHFSEIFVNIVHFCAADSFHQSRDCFQVRRIRCEVNRNFFAFSGFYFFR